MSKEKSLAEAVAILVEETHRSFPNVSTRPISPYEDEDFTLEVKKSLESDYPRPQAGAFRPIHGYATAISFD
jgi:hypothetical protein